MKLSVAIGAIAVAISAGGCAAQGPPFERATAPPEHAIIYVYRPYSFFGSAIRPPVKCGDQTVEIQPGAYHAFIVPPGHITCTVSAEAVQTGNLDELEIDADARVYYVREQVAHGALWGRPQLNPMDADQAQAEIRSCCVQQP